jgi:hypothetical protein
MPDPLHALSNLILAICLVGKVSIIFILEKRKWMLKEIINLP